MKRAVFPGSFDPPTMGHLNLIERAARLFDELDVVVAVNSMKSYLFSAEERKQLMSRLVAHLPNVSVTIWSSLIVNYAKEHGSHVVIRGIRGHADFGYEFDLSMVNKAIDPSIETIFIPTDPQYFVIRSSVIKELALLGGDISGMVPQQVAEALHKKISGS